MIPSMSFSDQLKHGDVASSSSVNQSGQHGFFLNLVSGRGSTLTPTNTDSSGKASPWVTGALVVGALGFAWLLFRRKKKKA